MIICTAEAQGFGPSSNLINYINLFERERIDDCIFIASGTSYEFLRSRDLKVIEGDYDFQNDFFSQNRETIEYVISVMESRTIILASHYKIQTKYIDLIYWLYKLEIHPTSLVNSCNQFMSSENSVLLKKLNDFTSKTYDQSFMKQRENFSHIAHHLSNQSICIEYIPNSKQHSNYLKLLNPSTKTIGPIVAPEFIFSNNTPVSYDFKKGLLNLGGMQKQNGYSSIMEIIYKSISTFFDISIAGGNNFNDQIDNLLTADALVKKMLEADFIITQPGFNCVYEALYLKKPTLILPPQNYGQSKFTKYLKTYLLSESFIEWSDIIENFDASWNSYEELSIRMTDEMEDFGVSITKIVLDRVTELKSNPILFNTLMSMQDNLIKKVGIQI